MPSGNETKELIGQSSKNSGDSRTLSAYAKASARREASARQALRPFDKLMAGNAQGRHTL